MRPKILNLQILMNTTDQQDHQEVPQQRQEEQQEVPSNTGTDLQVQQEAPLNPQQQVDHTTLVRDLPITLHEGGFPPKEVVGIWPTPEASEAGDEDIVVLENMPSAQELRPKDLQVLAQFCHILLKTIPMFICKNQREYIPCGSPPQAHIFFKSCAIFPHI